jgi:hypothetical protein
MADVAEVRASLAQFWGIGPGSNDQLAGIADELRSLESGQVELLGAYIPPGVPGTEIGGRCERLRTVVKGVLAEKAKAAAVVKPEPAAPASPPEPAKPPPVPPKAAPPPPPSGERLSAKSDKEKTTRKKTTTSRDKSTGRFGRKR